MLGYQANFDWGVWHPFAQVVWDHEFDPLSRVVTASLTNIAAPSYSMPAVVLGRDNCRDAGHDHAVLERTCFLHGAVRPAERNQLWRPCRRELRVRSSTSVGNRLQELMRVIKI